MHFCSYMRIVLEHRITMGLIHNIIRRSPPRRNDEHGTARGDYLNVIERARRLAQRTSAAATPRSSARSRYTSKAQRLFAPVVPKVYPRRIEPSTTRRSHPPTIAFVSRA